MQGEITVFVRLRRRWKLPRRANGGQILEAGEFGEVISGPGMSEQPRGSDAAARPSNAKPAPRLAAKSSVCTAMTDPTLARSNMRSNPVPDEPVPTIGGE